MANSSSCRIRFVNAGSAAGYPYAAYKAPVGPLGGGGTPIGPIPIGPIGGGGSPPGWIPVGPLGSSRTIVLGNRPDLPDLRDHHHDPKKPKEKAAEQLKPFMKKEKKDHLAMLGDLESSQLPNRIDLRDTGYLSPVEDQLDIGSCTAQAVIGMVEYLVRKAQSPPLDLSRMFLYKCTRRINGDTGDTGASIRDTIKALALFGSPPEMYWPYDRQLLDIEPEAFHYSFADNFRATLYTRLDSRPQGQSPAKTLDNLRRSLYDGFPVAFGFSVFSSIEKVDGKNPATHIIPFPDPKQDRLLGGHAVLAVGYDDNKEALLVRNSWGEDWGDQGYAWLPYSYVERGLAKDFWVVLNKKWFDL